MSDHLSPDHPDVLQRTFASPDAQVDALRAEVARLRERTHEIQAEEADRRAALESQLAHHRRCRNLAEDAVAEVAADWAGTTPGTFWQYSSQNTRDALTGLVEEAEALRGSAAPPELVERAQALVTLLTCPYYRGKGVCVSGCRDEPACMTDGPHADETIEVLSQVANLGQEDNMREWDPSGRSGAALIYAERERQMSQEGHSPVHDDGHDDGSLLAAAECYVAVGLMFVRPDHPHASPATTEMPIGPTGWPWLDGYKADLGGPIPNLVKAGALIAAEIDRLQRRG